GLLHLRPSLEVVVKQGNTQGPQRLHHVAAQHSQCFRRVTGHQNPFTVRDEMANEVRDGVALTRPWRTLNQYSAVTLERPNDLHLLVIRRLTQENVGRFTPG